MDFASIAPYINTALSFAAGAWAGPYLGGYARTKGENLATHEDIEKLKEQITMVTRTTEEIKTEISDAAWNRQKQSELKREVLVKGVKRLAHVEAALIDLTFLIHGEQAFNTPVSAEENHETLDKWSQAALKLEETSLLVGIVCGKEAEKAFGEFARLAHTVAAKAATGLKEEPQKFREFLTQLSDSLAAAKAAVRKELGSDA